MNVPLVLEKTEYPVSKLTFSGIELNTVEQTSMIPEAKLGDLWERVAFFLSKMKATQVELQQLVGHLSFSCKVVAPRRAFLHQLCDAMKGLQHPHHRLSVSERMQEDLLLWQTFLAPLKAFLFGSRIFGLRVTSMSKLMFLDRWDLGYIFMAIGVLRIGLRHGLIMGGSGILHSFFPISMAIWIWVEEISDHF